MSNKEEINNLLNLFTKNHCPNARLLIQLSNADLDFFKKEFCDFEFIVITQEFKDWLKTLNHSKSNSSNMDSTTNSDMLEVLVNKLNTKKTE